jgi:RNA polymerase-associated protein RTF1
MTSNVSGKNKKLLKASDRKASSKLEERMSNGSDSEDEKVPEKVEKVKAGRKVEKKNQPSQDDATIATWRNEFDDGLDDDLIGDAEDRTRMEEMNEKEREEEIFKRAEKREELRKRFEISQKLKLQQKDKPVHEKSDG